MTNGKQSAVMRIDQLNREAGTNPRVSLDPTVVRDYAMAMRLGDVFSPVLAVTDGTVFWLVDGYHRVAALELNGQETVVVVYHWGSIDDAVWESCAANRTHGLHRSNADKHHCVERALRSHRGARLSDRQIGRYCGVHHDTVGRIRRELVAAAEICSSSERDVVRVGRNYCQNTKGVSASNQLRSKAVAVSAFGGEPAQSLPYNTGENYSIAPVLVEEPRPHLRNMHSMPPAPDSLVRTLESSLNGACDAPRAALDSLEDMARVLLERTGSLPIAKSTPGPHDYTSLLDLVTELRRLSRQILRELTRIRTEGRQDDHDVQAIA